MSGSDYDFGDQPSILGEETQPRTLYVGNLDLQMSEEFLHVLFSQIGPVKGCKIIHEGLLLVGCVMVELVCCVLWNVRPLVKVRLRPPRHQMPPNLHNQNNQPYHRAHTFPQRHRMPHHEFPVYSYRPPNPTPLLKHMQTMSSNNQNRFRGPPPTPPQQHFIQDEILMDQHKLIKFETPSSNLLENTMSSLDDGQHGSYLSPKYKGWKPITKPHFHVPSQEGKGDRHTYPTTEAYQDINGRHHKLMLTTLFRDNVKSIKPPGHVKLKPEYSENRGIAIPLPKELSGSSITLPSSIFLDRPQTNFNFHPPAVSTSHSEDKPVIRKPFPRFQQKIKTDDKANLSFSNTPKEIVGAAQGVSKYKFMKPKIRPPITTPPYDNEPEIEGIGPTNLPKIISPFPTKAPETSSQLPPSMSLKDKYSKVRTRIRTRRPEGHVNTEDLRQVFSQQRPDPSESLINPKEAYQDPLRQQEHNSLSSAPTTFSKNSTTFASPSYVNENNGAHYPERSHGEYSTNRNHPSNHGTPLAEISGNKNSDRTKVNVFESNSGLENKPQRERKRKPNGQGKHTESDTPVVYAESPVYSEEFYLPPGFLQNPSLNGHNPVSFMTMPNSQPQVIHHTGHNRHPQQSPHQLYPINVVGSVDHHKSKHNDGASPNSNYVQNNRPHFHFMNIQNGQPTAPETLSHEAPLFTPQTYDSGVTPQPFQYSSFPEFRLSETTRSPEQNPSLRYHHHHHTPTSGSPSTTSRNPYAYPSDSRFLSHYINQPNGDSNSHNPTRVSQVRDYSRSHENGQTLSHHPSINLDAYASNEYKQIPLEFMNHLRPILVEEGQELELNSAVPAQTAPSGQTEYYSSEMYPPSDYFDNFFKSYEVPQGNQGNVWNRYATQQNGNTIRNHHDSSKSSSNSHVQIVEPNFENPNKSLTQTNTPKWSPPKVPIVSVSPIHEYTVESTISPIHDIELFERKPQVTKNWSKLINSGESGISTSTESFLSPTSKYKRLTVESTVQKLDKPQGTTLRPLFPSSFSSIKEENKGSVSPSIIYLNTTPLYEKIADSSKETVESTTARNLRTRGTTSTTTESVGVIETKSPQQLTDVPSLQRGTRPLRRRKVGMLGHKFFTSSRVNEVGDEKLSDPPVTTHRPRRLILSTSTGATIDRHDDSTESFEVARSRRLKARRRFFNRRMNVHANRAGMIGLRATTPPSSEASDSVTYGESQWFRIKDLPEVMERSEVGKPEKSSTEKSDIPFEEGGTQFSSRALSTIPNVQPLEMSSESLIESESSSGRNFYEASDVGTATDGKQESRDEPT